MYASASVGNGGGGGGSSSLLVFPVEEVETVFHVEVEKRLCRRSCSLSGTRGSGVRRGRPVIWEYMEAEAPERRFGPLSAGAWEEGWRKRAGASLRSAEANVELEDIESRTW